MRLPAIDILHALFGPLPVLFKYHCSDQVDRGYSASDTTLVMLSIVDVKDAALVAPRTSPSNLVTPSVEDRSGDERGTFTGPGAAVQCTNETISSLRFKRQELLCGAANHPTGHQRTVSAWMVSLKMVTRAKLTSRPGIKRFLFYRFTKYTALLKIYAAACSMYGSSWIQPVDRHVHAYGASAARRLSACPMRLMT